MQLAINLILIDWIDSFILGNIYEARRMILGCSGDDEKVVALVPPAYLISSSDPAFSFRKQSPPTCVTFCFVFASNVS